MPDATRRSSGEDPKSGSPVAFPRTHTTERPLHNLPLDISSFVGREREIAEVKSLLSGNRLITLTGSGGCGKTRLALAVASEVVEDFEDGVWLVELASLSDPTLVPQVVASVLGVREQPGHPLTETLSDNLGSKKVLLVLDNCEHLIDACAELAAALLRTCSNLRILATSREALGLVGETSWLVPSLSLPDPRRLPGIESLPQYEAARLFVERVAAVKPAFTLTERNATAVARVCYRLDGIPLAIELAAVRAKVLSVEQIAGRLDESFGLLTSGGRAAIPHHRTLRATMDWSHELLSEEEQVLFRRLAVFAGGFTLEAAEAVGAGEDLEKEAVLDVLSRLVDKSMVVAREQDGEARYRLLEVVRQYGREKLDESGEEPAIRRRQAGFFLELAERVEPKINSKDRGLWLERLEVEHGNLRAALAWSREEAAEGETGLRLAGALFWFWFHRGYLSEGRRWLDRALATQENARGRSAWRAARAKALSGAGLLAWLQGDQAAASSRLEESVTLWRELEDKQGLAQALRVLSHVMLGRGDPAVARSLGEESVKLFRECKDEFGLATSLATLGLVALTQEDHATAQAFLEESVAVCRESGDDWALGLALRNLGIGAFRQGDYERAAALLGESMAALREPGNTLHIINLELLAAAVSMRGDHGRAARLFGAAEALRKAAGGSVLPSTRADYDRGVAAARAGLDEAAWEAAWAQGRQMTPEQAAGYALGSSPYAGTQPSAPTGHVSATNQLLFEPLTVRELEVLGLIADGLSNQQIATRLFVAVTTVKTYVNAIFKKLGVKNRTQAAAEGRRLRLISE